MIEPTMEPEAGGGFMELLKKFGGKAAGAAPGIASMFGGGGGGSDPVSGALGGAAQGAQLGMIGGPIGGAIGGAAGLLGGGALSALSKKNELERQKREKQSQAWNQMGNAGYARALLEGNAFNRLMQLGM